MVIPTRFLYSIKAILFSSAVFWSFTGWAQKPPVDYEAMASWPEINGEKISNDGRFVIYNIHTRARGIQADWYVKATDNSWQRQLPQATQLSISSDSRYIIYIKGGDSVIVYDPVKDARQLAVPGNSYQISFDADRLLLAVSLRSLKQLQLYDVNKKDKRSFSAVENFELSGDGAVLVTVTDSVNRKAVKWLDLAANKEYVIASGNSRFANFSLDVPAQQLAFTEDITGGMETYTRIRYFRRGEDTAVIKVTPDAPGLDSGYTVQSGQPRFNKTGTKIFFQVRIKAGAPEKDKTKADVTIWHYGDVSLPGEQMQQLARTTNFAAVIPVDGDNAIQLTGREYYPFNSVPSKGKLDFVIVSTSANIFSVDTSNANRSLHYLVNTSTGARRLLIAQRDITVYLSPGERFAVWYDPYKDLYFSYDIEAAKLRSITSALKGLVRSASPPGRLFGPVPFGIAGWLPGDSALLIYDQYDIWKVDPHGISQPVNITAGYGRRNKTILRLWGGTTSDYDITVIKEPEVLLCAFSTETNRNGFYKTSLQQVQDPVTLTMDDCLYYGHMRFNLSFMLTPPMYKAAGADVYLLRRQRADQYPELVTTRDFRRFTQLTALKPEAAYTWMKAEPIRYRLPDGRQAAAVLYKPSDFDSAKKYPVIFYFYEKLSHRLHLYIQPDLSEGSLNIPFLVSNGYLICTPDIDYKKGKTGASALEYVMAAANYVGKLPYVNEKKMGLQGHSFGGYQVNYIISKTGLFAAAQPSAGASDFISYYNGNYRQSSGQFYFEVGQGRMGCTLWERPELFLENSPVFSAHHVTTPVLLMHNKEDAEVPFQQGLEWFTALKRTGKKVWMLQYDKEFHGINQHKNQLDFTIRMKQFFDHYLKGAPQPAWMK